MIAFALISLTIICRKLVRSLSSDNDFVSYIDAVDTLDGKRCLLEWKTTTARYPEEPNGLLALDPQLICYSWFRGISDAAVVAFVRKRVPEIQYLKTKITDEQRREFGQLVGTTVSQIEAGQFLPHSGIPLPPKRLCQLRGIGPMPGQSAACRCQTHSSPRSDRS